MRKLIRGLVLGAALAAPLAAPLAIPTAAHARVSADFDYSYAQMWQASVRLVRVDLACPVTDRDEDIGFVMFDYATGGRTYQGSLELVRTNDNGVDRIRVVVQVPRMPSYVERMIVDRLTRKLREEFGEPQRPRPARPPAVQPREPVEEEPGGDEAPTETPPRDDDPRAARPED